MTCDQINKKKTLEFNRQSIIIAFVKQIAIGEYRAREHKTSNIF